MRRGGTTVVPAVTPQLNSDPTVAAIAALPERPHGRQSPMFLDNDEVKTRKVSLETVTPSSEFSRTFLDGMLARMGMSYFKYGKIADAYPGKVDAVESLRLRLDKYAETGNTEYLMDVANFAMIEFMHPAHPGAYFEATDSDQSPGRVGNNGGRNQANNQSRVWSA